MRLKERIPSLSDEFFLIYDTFIFKQKGVNMHIYVQTQNFGTHGMFGYQFHHQKYSYPLHIHQFAELMLIINGGMEIIVNGRLETFRSGQIALVFPFQVHRYHSLGTCKFAIFTFSPSIISDFMKTVKGK